MMPPFGQPMLNQPTGARNPAPFPQPPLPHPPLEPLRQPLCQPPPPPLRQPLPLPQPPPPLCQFAQFTLTPSTSFEAAICSCAVWESICLTFAIRSPIRVSSLAPVLIGLAFASLGSRPAQAASCNATAINDLDVFISLDALGASLGRNISSQDPPLDESKEKRLRLPSPKAFGGRHVGGCAFDEMATTAKRRNGDRDA